MCVLKKEIKMKYHNYIIKKVKDDLGEEYNESLNCVYDKNGKYINECLTLSNAKEYIDSNFDSNVLC